MEEKDTTTEGTALRISREEAQSIADLLRYAISLNTTAGLISPTERRLATPTYRAAELAALVLEGMSFDEALTRSSETWTGSLEEDHHRALGLVEESRETLMEAMSGRLTPEDLTEYLEVIQDQFLELVRSGLAHPKENERPSE